MSLWDGQATVGWTREDEESIYVQEGEEAAYIKRFLSEMPATLCANLWWHILSYLTRSIDYNVLRRRLAEADPDFAKRRRIWALLPEIQADCGQIEDLTLYMAKEAGYPPSKAMSVAGISGFVLGGHAPSLPEALLLSV